MQQLQLPESATFVETRDPTSIPTTYFCCPNGHPRNALQPTFSPARPFKPAWCPTCKSSFGGRRWSCPCHKPWTECSVHFSAVPVGLIRRPAVKRHAVQPMDLPTAHAKLRRLESGVVDQALHFSPGLQLQARLQHIHSQASSSSNTPPITAHNTASHR